MYKLLALLCIILIGCNSDQHSASLKEWTETWDVKANTNQTTFVVQETIHDYKNTRIVYTCGDAPLYVGEHFEVTYTISVAHTDGNTSEQDCYWISSIREF